jgi:hypothetical protein
MGTGNLQNHDIGIFESYGENLLNAAEIAHFRLNRLYDKASPALSGIINVMAKNKKEDFSHLKPEIAEQRKSAKLHDARKHLLYILQKEIEETSANVINVENRILKETEPQKFDDDLKTIRQQMHHQEIRNNFLGLSIEARNTLLNNAVKEGNKDIITAIASSPISMVEPDHLLELRKDFAFKHNPTLQTTYNQAKQLESICRMKCGNLNATAKKILMAEEIEDPISHQEHFTVFQPRTRHELYCANRKIDEEIKAKLAQDSLHTSNIQTADQIEQAA